jgi:hypothetical protein
VKTLRQVLFAFLCLALLSCSSISRNQSAALGSSVEATNSALSAGRFDLAKQYAAQSARLTVPPKRKAKIKAFVSSGNGTHYITLPVEFQDTPRLALGSPAMEALLSADKPLERQLRAEERALGKVTSAGDKVIAAKERFIEKAEAEKMIAAHSFWHRVKLWGFWLSIGAALAALCYFVPVLVPVALSAGKFILGAIRKVLGK